MGDAFDAYAVRDHIGMTRFTGVILQYHLKLLRVDTLLWRFFSSKRLQSFQSLMFRRLGR